uniref:Uncharacterized protein n=1 Tax=Tanacetum cinerariifolium TaxID=118510 RepID=A0A699H1V7_TANCI|nr:hypothetical protein [Tanacetum cinerariifolium]
MHGRGVPERLEKQTDVSFDQEYTRNNTLMQDYKSSGKSYVFSDMRIGVQNEELWKLDKKIMRPKLDMRIPQPLRVKNRLKRLKKKLNHKVVGVKCENKPENEAEGSSEQTTDKRSNLGMEQERGTKPGPGRIETRNWLMRSNNGGIGGPMCQGFLWFQERRNEFYTLRHRSWKLPSKSCNHNDALKQVTEGFSYQLENKEVVVLEKNDDNDDGVKDDEEEEVMRLLSWCKFFVFVMADECQKATEDGGVVRTGKKGGGSHDVIWS